MIDIEGETSNLMNSINFEQYDFDLLLVEKETNNDLTINKKFNLEMEDKFNYYFVKNK